jgi:hypothetical protein
MWAMLCVFPCTVTQLSVLSRTHVHTLSNGPGFTRNTWQEFSAGCCSTSKSLIDDEYTEVFRGPRSQKSRGLRSGNHAGQLIGPSHPIYCYPKVWSRCCLTMRENEFAAWTTRVAVREGARAPRVLVNPSSKRRWYTASVSLLGKTPGPKYRSP